MKKILFTLCLLLGAIALSAQAKTVLTDEYKNEVRNKLALDYSMPDYSTTKFWGKSITPYKANKTEEKKYYNVNLNLICL